VDAISSYEFLGWCDDITGALARPGQTLIKHAVGVVNRVVALTQLWDLPEEVKILASLAGVLHDIGKLQCEFQEALVSGGKTPAHGPISACTALLLIVEETFGQSKLSNISPYLNSKNLPVLWISVYSHHGYMKDVLGKESWLRGIVRKDKNKIPIVDVLSMGGCKYLKLDVVSRFIDDVSDEVKRSIPWIEKIGDIFRRWSQTMDYLEVEERAKLWKKILKNLQRTSLNIIPDAFLLMDVMTILKTADRYDAASEDFPEEQVILKDILEGVEDRIMKYLGRE